MIFDSRVEKQLLALIGEDVALEKEMSHLETLLRCLRTGDSYPFQPETNVEKQFLHLVNETIQIEVPQSRVEFILQAIHDGDDLSRFIPLSRVEELLLRLQNFNEDRILDELRYVIFDENGEPLLGDMVSTYQLRR